MFVLLPLLLSLLLLILLVFFCCCCLVLAAACAAFVVCAFSVVFAVFLFLLLVCCFCVLLFLLFVLLLRLLLGRPLKNFLPSKMSRTILQLISPFDLEKNQEPIITKFTGISKKKSKTPPKFHEKTPERTQRILWVPALLGPRLCCCFCCFRCAPVCGCLLLLLLFLHACCCCCCGCFQVADRGKTNLCPLLTFQNVCTASPAVCCRRCCFRCLFCCFFGCFWVAVEPQSLPL